MKPGDPARIDIQAIKVRSRQRQPRHGQLRQGHRGHQQCRHVRTSRSTTSTSRPPETIRWSCVTPPRRARPVHLLLNGKLVKEDAAGKITGSFFPDGQKWEVQGVYAFKQGKNVFKIESDGAIPHFNKILIVPGEAARRTAFPSAPPSRSPRSTISMWRCVRHSVRFLGDVKSDPSKLAPAELRGRREQVCGARHRCRTSRKTSIRTT